MKFSHKKNRSSKIESPIVRYTLRVLLFLVIVVVTYCLFFIYDEALSESARLSKKFSNKIESLSNSGVTSIKLRDLTDFEWDVVCIYGDADKGESINLKDPNLEEQIGYKPNFLFRSTYFVPYDFVGLVFSNSKTKKIKVLHRVWHWSYFEFDGRKMYFTTGCYKANQELTITK